MWGLFNINDMVKQQHIYKFPHAVSKKKAKVWVGNRKVHHIQCVSSEKASEMRLRHEAKKYMMMMMRKRRVYIEAYTHTIFLIFIHLMIVTVKMWNSIFVIFSGFSFSLMTPWLPKLIVKEIIILVDGDYCETSTVTWKKLIPSIFHQAQSHCS